MTSTTNWATSRRLFMQFLAASPLLATTGSEALADEGLKISIREPDPVPWAALGANGLIKSPKDAIDIFDFELVAHEKVPPAHFGYMASGVDDDFTLRANRADFGKVQLRPRRLRDVSKVDSSIKLFGAKWDSPIFVCPTASNRAFHPDGEIAVSRAAEAGRHLQILSTFASVSLEDAIRARHGTPVWFQLYATSSFDIAKDLVARAERAGSPVLAITVDGVGYPKYETFERMKPMDRRTCTDCHVTSSGGTNVATVPNFSDIDAARWKGVSMASAGMDWDFVRRLRDTTKMKVILKGIIAPEDAQLCAEHGLDGVLISNHGGRSEDTGTSTIGVLPDVVEAVRGRIPILVDSGFRRGMDVVKALAMGATAVGVGRPYLWGLGAFGQPGVERVLEILRTETKLAMAQAGAATVNDLVPAMIHRT